MWYMPGDTENVLTTVLVLGAYGNGFCKEVINRGTQLKLSYIDLAQSDF